MDKGVTVRRVVKVGRLGLLRMEEIDVWMYTDFSVSASATDIYGPLFLSKRLLPNQLRAQIDNFDDVVEESSG